MKRRSKALLAAGAGILSLSLVFAYGFAEPRTAAGHFTFHTFYLFPPTRPGFLQWYSRTLRAEEGGYLPPAIDEFLADRLTEPESREWRGIVAFYIAQQPSRWGSACGRLHESLKPALVNHLLATVDADPPEIQISKLVFIEYLRLDGNLHKGGFVHGTVLNWDEQQRHARYDPVKIQQAIAAFRSWNSQSLPWSALRTSDPLAGTGMRISSGSP